MLIGVLTSYFYQLHFYQSNSQLDNFYICIVKCRMEFLAKNQDFKNIDFQIFKLAFLYKV